MIGRWPRRKLYTVRNLPRVRHDGRLHHALVRRGEHDPHSEGNEAGRSQNILQPQTRRRVSRADRRDIDAAQTAAAAVGEGVRDEGVRQRVVQHAGVAVEAGARRPRGTDDLRLDVGDPDAACVQQVGRGVGAVLGLDDLVEEARVEGRRGHVGAVAPGRSQRGDVLGRVLLLDDGRVARSQAYVAVGRQAEQVGQDGAVVVGRDGQEVGHAGPRRGPECEGPLRVQTTLGPTDHSDVAALVVTIAADGREVVDGVGDVLGVDLGVPRHSAGHVQPHRVRVR